MTTAVPETERPLRAWGVLIGVLVVAAVACGAVAIAGSIQANRFIGEGELLFDDTAMAAARIDALAGDVETELRHIRNDLEIEAVSLVSSSLTVVASTSPSLEGLRLEGMLAGSVEDRRFTALAVPLNTDLVVGGVVEWHPGDVLYQSVHPTADGAVMLTYDLSELLRRRAAATRTPGHVVPMAVLAGILMLVAAGVAVARARAIATRRAMELEADFLRRQSLALQEHNLELEMARAETEAALALAEEKNRIRSEFVLMINHELRTPLTGVVTGSRLLQADELDEETRRQLLEDMVRDGERLESIIGQMLAVARVENRGLEVVPVEMRLSELVSRLDRAHRAVTFDVEDDLSYLGTIVRTDATTLAQLVAGLVDNAITHGATRVHGTVTDTLPAPSQLCVGATPERPVYVVVGDNGPGIDPEFLPRAFDKFTKSSRSSGTGLGLHFSKMMAESISASICVHTTPNGTWMAVGIPMVRVEEMAEAKA